MINPLSKHIIRQLLIGTLVVTVGLTCIIWLAQSLRFIELIVNKGLSATIFIRLTLLLLPEFLIIVLPIALFAVVLFVFNKMTADRELVVMQGIGMTPLQIGKPVLIFAGLLTCLSYYLTMIAVPNAVKEFREMRWALRHDLSQVLLQEEEFNHLTDGLTIYVGSRDENGTLRNIFVHDSREKDKSISLFAKEGALVMDDGANPKFLMLNGSREETIRGTGRMNALFFDKHTIEFENVGKKGEIRFKDARERSLRELFNITEADGFSAVDVRKFRVAGHNRILQPLQLFALSIVALVGMITGTFNRRGNLTRILITIGVMVVLQMLFLGATSIAAKNLQAVPLLYLFTLFPLCFGVYVLARPPLLPRPRSFKRTP
jgi:lipopolysaccharide export system permease protein